MNALTPFVESTGPEESPRPQRRRSRRPGRGGYPSARAEAFFWAVMAGIGLAIAGSGLWWLFEASFESAAPALGLIAPAAYLIGHSLTELTFPDD